MLVALTILAVGLLGAAGTLLAARRAVGAAERLHVATQAAADVADSLLASGAVQAGQRRLEWGRLVWARDGGGVRLVAEDAFGAALASWWFLAPVAAP